MSLTLGCRLFLMTTSSSIWIGEVGRAPPVAKVVGSGDRKGLSGGSDKSSAGASAISSSSS
jgi:hypothetical protein